MKGLLNWILLFLAFPAFLHAQIKEDIFVDPANEYKPIPLWFWNDTTVEEQELLSQFREMIRKDGYGGCAILPFGKSFQPEYLSESYFALYGGVIEEAKKLGVRLSLYDEYGFPSGSMGAINADGVPRFMDKYPNATIKRLDKIEYKAEAGTRFTRKYPSSGTLMSVVAMDTLSGNRLSLRKYMKGGQLEWNVPEGAWKVMFFACVKDGDPNVDYLDPAAVRLFVKETHQAYYDRFSSSFGNVIIETFFDEPTLYRAGGRMWTERFNDAFEARYGCSPELLYPALWYDIGKETQSARNRLFGTRAQLYAEGFMRTIQEWAVAHGIQSTGHQDQEEILNPVSISGDLMLCGKYMGIPGIDKIGGNRPAELFYKVVSSSAYNWDKQLVMSETYGAMGNISMKEMYHIAMEQYTKGINQLIPHAVWYNDKKVTFLPELSWRNNLYNQSLPAFNKFLSRLNYVLRQEGRHVADIAILYPIESLYGEHFLDGELGFYEGGVRIPDTDYTHISSLLTDTLGRDFTYLHPEVLADKCSVENGVLRMHNPVNSENFPLIIIPGMKTISLSSLRKIEQFHQAGGSVLFTTRLPLKSVEPGGDPEVNKIVNRLLSSDRPATSGKVFFIEEPAPAILGERLADCLDVPDVAFAPGQALNYIHKEVGGQSIYYLANLKEASYSANVVLRGKVTPRLLDPHSGESTGVEYRHQVSRGMETTSVFLSVNGNSSVFIIGEK